MELNFPEKEQEILKFWEENKVFEKSIKRRARARDFIFYEGPPTANAKPGIHHVLTRVFKDIICRYKTMRGFKVLRKAGWDTHGLPVELAIEKKLGLKNKKEIEKYGIAEFNKECKKSIWAYKQDWEKLTERIGYWLDMKTPYITYGNEYIETLWWIIKQIWQKNLLYKDYKVVPYCPRCGTSLSSHEVALGYKKVKEPSIYIKLKIKGSDKRYLLVWTTTPWTLPGNVAVALNPRFIYAEVKSGEDHLILAKERMMAVEVQGEIIKEFTGEDLLGLEYEPLYNFSKPDKKTYLVIPGNFVSLDEGTGLVHIAPAFGEDDMSVGKENNLPVLMTVDETGRFKPEIEHWAGTFVKDADPLIIKNLEERKILFKEELYEHDYPFCWRCNSPLLYYAKESWFIKMQAVKKDLIASNQKINWVPTHLKDGRFGEWLKELKDWAFSRERYWGTPLPVWQCKKCGAREVIGGKNDLAGQKFSTNTYYVLRHGESTWNIKKVFYRWPEKNISPLTKKGIKQAQKAARELKEKKIDLIFASDFSRTKETAEAVAQETKAKIIFDKRIRDLDLGPNYDGRPLAEAQKAWGEPSGRFEKGLPEGESYNDVKKRMYDFLKDINAGYKNKNILIISHECPISFLESASRAFPDEEIVKYRGSKKKIETGEWRKLEFKIWPYGEKMQLDFHRPYIDQVEFACRKCGAQMERVKEVADVWFDSGSMPFAQSHYPFEKKNLQFPAEYISEAIDQTRGWFYTLLAVSTLLSKGSPYKNVVSLGHVLDEKGEKMSKSKGNVVDPWYIIEKYGADAVRWYFYTVNQPGDPKLFAEKDIDQSLKKFILIFWNSFQFYQIYISSIPQKRKRPYGGNILDKWVRSRLNELIEETTQKIDKYDVTGAARLLEDFVVNDLSLWYIRRSRKRFEEAESTLAFVIQTLSKLTAPFIPFLSEEIYQAIGNRRSAAGKSVHLENWPKADKKLINKKLNQEMAKIREIVAAALAERAKAGIKVRQPLACLRIPEKISQELLGLIKDEINVKKVVFGKELKLDTEITPELKEEGISREVIRQVQEMRKEAGLKPKDKISIQYSGTPELEKILEKNRKNILTQTQAEDFKPGKGEKQVEINRQKLNLTVKKL